MKFENGNHFQEYFKRFRDNELSEDDGHEYEFSNNQEGNS